MDRLEQLRGRMDELVADSQAVASNAEAEKRDLAREEEERIDANTAEFNKVSAELRRREMIAAQAEALDVSAGRRTSPEPLRNGEAADDAEEEEPALGQATRPQAVVTRAGAPKVRSVSPRSGNAGFRSFGDFARAVHRASIHGGVYDQRLDWSVRAAATTFGQESVGEQGGFLVPPDFTTEIVQKVMAEDTLLGRTDQMTSSSNMFTFPADETTPWQTSGGVLAFWENEGGVKPPSRPLFESKSVRLNKLVALVNVTDELLEDAPALDTYLRRKAPEKINFKVNLAIVQGTGVGQPLGILNSPALVTVAKESGQIADTVVFNNIRKMWARFYAGSRPRAIWLANQDVETAFMAMQFPSTAGTFPVYLPPGGLSSSPYSQLLGRPVVVTEACETLGDLGDLILADMSAYMTIRKAAGIRTDTSIHLYFDQDITSFRFVFRVGGIPWWSGPIARRDGTNTLSAFVTLAERA